MKVTSSAIADGALPLSNKHASVSTRTSNSISLVPTNMRTVQCNVNGTLTPPLRLQMNLVQQKRVILDHKGTIKTVKRCPHLDT